VWNLRNRHYGTKVRVSEIEERNVWGAEIDTEGAASIEIFIYTNTTLAENHYNRHTQKPYVWDPGTWNSKNSTSFSVI